MGLVARNRSSGLGNNSAALAFASTSAANSLDSSWSLRWCGVSLKSIAIGNLPVSSMPLGKRRPPSDLDDLIAELRRLEHCVRQRTEAARLADRHAKLDALGSGHGHLDDRQ